MRQARQEDLPALSALMFEQFYEKEELQQQFAGIEPETARGIGPLVVRLGQGWFFQQGDIFLCDGPDGTLSGELIGADPCRLSQLGPLGQLIYGLRNRKLLRPIPRKLMAQIAKNSRPVMAVHSASWYRRYDPRPYYIAQFAVAQAFRGTGIARTLLDGACRHAAAQGFTSVALETLSRENVPMYLHFGFVLKQVYRQNGFTEYRLIKRLPQP